MARTRMFGRLQQAASVAAEAATACADLRPQAGKRCPDIDCGRFRGIPRPLAPAGTLGTTARHRIRGIPPCRFRPKLSTPASATACVPLVVRLSIRDRVRS